MKFSAGVVRIILCIISLCWLFSLSYCSDVLQHVEYDV